METSDIAIIASAQDRAGMNIAENLRQLREFPAMIGGKSVSLHVVQERVTKADLSGIAAGMFIFASRHVSKAGVHSLTVHSIGNFGEAADGGEKGTLVPAPAALMKSCLQLLDEKVAKEKLNYEVMQEATHHGPLLEKPAMFIEIGSDEERWADAGAGKIVAETIIEAIKNYGGEEEKTAVGIGGTHYCANLRKVAMGSELAIGIVCPKHHLLLLDEAMLRQMLEKTAPKAEMAVLDWKGLGQEKARILALLESIGVPYKRTKDY